MNNVDFLSIIAVLDSRLDETAKLKRNTVELYEKAVKTDFGSSERLAASLQFMSLRRVCPGTGISRVVWNDLISYPLRTKVNPQLICLLWSTACFNQGMEEQRSFARDKFEDSLPGPNGMGNYWYTQSVFSGPIEWFGVDIYFSEGSCEALTQELFKLGVEKITCTDEALRRISTALNYQMILKLVDSKLVERIESDAQSARPKPQCPPNHVIKQSGKN